MLNTPVPAPPRVTPPRILIVDDHPNAASILARGLGQFNRPVEILTARSGEEALELINQSPVDLLITDFMMPGMNGLELIEKLKEGQEPKHTVLITAYDSPGLAATARRLKVNDYLVKPFQPEKIRTIVGKALEVLSLPKPAPAIPSTPTQFRILIADDRPDNVHLLATRLSSEGYTFITAGDGEETLRKVREELPDLVLLDVDMPRKNGFEVLAEMRGDAEIAHVPVIILTAARATLRDVVEGLGLGADDYVTKPFDWRELAARMRAKLRVKQAEDALRRRNRELGLLPDIGQDLSARLDVEELADVTLRRSVETLKAANGHLVVFQPDGNALHKHHTPQDFSPWTWEQAQQRLVAEGIVAQVVADRQGLIIEDTQVDPHWLKAPNDLTQSALAVPLSSRRGVIGVLTLTHEQPAFFKPDQLALLQAIAGQAAIAIENAQLYTIEHKRVNELVALNQLTREISLFTHSKELFARIPELIQETLGYPTISLWLTEEGTLTLRSIAGAENAPRHSILALAPQEVASRGQPVHISGVVEERANPREGSSGGAPPTQSSVAVPLFWEAEMSGVLAIHSLRPYAFQESDRVLLETVAAQVATALDRIRLFESVEQEERRLAAVLRGAADAILVMDTDGQLRLLNPAGYRLFTTDHVEIKLGQPLPVQRGYDDLIKLLDQARQSGATEQGEIDWPDKRTLAVLITPIEDGGQVAVLHDVTHFKDLDRVKNEFIATASHDLKNPIASILGYSDLLEKAGPLNPQQGDFVNRIQKAAEQMHELVLNLLELARMDMGTELKLEPCSLSDLLVNMTDEFHPQAAAKQQTLTLLPLDSRPQVKGDVLRLRQVMRNLVGNAIKYTPVAGQVTVSAEIREQTVQVKIQDTGIGIPPADLPFIFDKFYRVQMDATEGIEGNGLGLAIVKSIVEKHRGQVSVESTVGQGTCFSFTLPLLTASGELSPDGLGEYNILETQNSVS